MNYAILKFHFSTAVHFGDGVLNSSVTSFMADTLFSSLFIESLKMNMNQQLLDYVNSGKLLFSDSFPFKGKVYFLPKPIMAVRNEDSENQKIKKKVKKIKYLPCDKVDDFVNSKLDFEKYADVKFCRLDEDTKAAVRNAEKEEPLPYRVGVCTFMENCGLYVIAGYENPSIFEAVKTLFGLDKDVNFSTKSVEAKARAQKNIESICLHGMSFSCLQYRSSIHSIRCQADSIFVNGPVQHILFYQIINIINKIIIIIYNLISLCIHCFRKHLHVDNDI